MKQLLFLISFLLITASCWAVTYNIGPGQLYETWAAFHTAVTPNPGDIMDGGDNTFTEKILPTAGGTSSACITYQNIVIEGGRILDYGIYIWSATDGDYHTYKNISVNGTTQDGIQLANGCDNIILENVKVSNGRERYGIIVQGNNVTVKDSEIHGTHNDGLVLACGGVVEVNNVYIWDTDASGAGLGDGLAVENNDVTSQIHIQNCEIEQWTNAKSSLFIDVGGTVEIEDCLFWGKDGDEKGIRLVKSGTVEIHHNLFHDLSFGVVTISNLDANVSIYENAFYTMKDAVFEIWDGVALICNNTVFSCSKGLHVNNAGAVTFKNNIIYGDAEYCAIEIYDLAGYIGDNNCFYPPASINLVSYKGNHYPVLSLYQAGETQDQNTLGLDPLLAGHHLTVESPCRNTGIEVIGIHDQALPARDIDNEKVMSNNATSFPDIGCDEFHLNVEQGITPSTHQGSISIP